jgi:hypothetical protein
MATHTSSNFRECWYCFGCVTGVVRATNRGSGDSTRGGGSEPARSPRLVSVAFPVVSSTTTRTVSGVSRPRAAVGPWATRNLDVV